MQVLLIIDNLWRSEDVKELVLEMRPGSMVVITTRHSDILGEGQLSAEDLTAMNLAREHIHSVPIRPLPEEASKQLLQAYAFPSGLPGVGTVSLDLNVHAHVECDHDQYL